MFKGGPSPFPCVGVSPGLLPCLHIGLGGEDVQVHLGEGGGGPGGEDLLRRLRGRLQTLVGEAIAGDVTYTTTMHHSISVKYTFLLSFYSVRTATNVC